jgi:hypothetical protein
VPQAAFIPIFTAIGFSAAAAATAAGILQTILINVALGAISKALAKKPRVHAPPINVTIRNPVENRRLLFGTIRAGGSFVFYDVSGDNNKYLWYVIVLAGHQVADIRDVWLDTQRVADSAIGGGAPEGGAVTTGVFANKLWIYKHPGTSAQTVDVDLDAAFSVWTGNHRLRGSAYSVVKMERDDAKYPQGAPQNATALVDGALLYDPRKDSTVPGGSGAHRASNPSTWEFGTIGRNPALIWRWFVSGGSVHNDSSTRLIKYGLREADSRIVESYVIAAANKCDETLSASVAPPSGSQSRYRCDLEVSTGETRRDIIEDILATMAGTHVVVHGQHRIYAGAYDTPIHSFTQDDLYGQLEIEDTVDHARRYNAVAGVFRDAAKDYVEQTTIFRTDASYETQDGGKQIPIEIDVRGVTDQYQAQRLCEIKLRKSRMMRSVKLVGALNLLKVAQYETLSYSHSRYSWSGRIFRCLERQFDFNEEAGRVALTCQREDSAVYADLLTADYTTGTSSTDVFVNETPDPPTGLRTTGRVNGILVEWNRPALIYAGTTFEARESTSSSMTSPTTVYQGPDLQFLIGKTTTGNFYYQVRSLRNGQPSAWEPLTNGILGKASSVSAALSATVAPGSASSSGGATSQTTNTVTVTPAGGTSPYTYAWTWASGGASITTDSSTAATTSFSATGLTSGETRSGQARCTVTDNVSATYTIDVDVTITRPAATVTAPAVGLYGFAISPTDSSVAFKVDADGHWYSSVNLGAPTTDRGLWCNPVEYAGDYEIRVTRTGGTETVFTSGPTLGSWFALTIDREWRLTETGTFGLKTIVFTIDIRRASDLVIVSTTTNNDCQAETESGA